MQGKTEMIPMNFQRFFYLGLKRDLPEIIRPNGLTVDLGAGNTPVPGAEVLDYPDWDATKDPMPYADSSLSGIFAFHFFEHLTGEEVIRVLREAERVLMPGGILTAGTPHRLGSMAYQDLDHKSFWCEDTWRVLFDNPHYDKNRETPWKFKVHFNMVAGLVERNLMLFSQLIRTS